MKVIFQSKNIDYVELTEELIADYLVMINDIENVARFISKRRRVYTEDMEREFVRSKLAAKDPAFSMIERCSGEFIGNVEFMPVEEDGVAEMGITITAKKQNVGYGKEAIARVAEYGMSELGLERIVLRVFPDNERAIHVYEACGFCEYYRTDEDVYMDIHANAPK